MATEMTKAEPVAQAIAAHGSGQVAELEAWSDSVHAQEALNEFMQQGGRTMEEIEKELDLD